MSGMFSGERAVVIGLGASGRAASRALAEEGADVLVSECRPAGAIGETGELVSLGVDVRADRHEPAHLDGATIVVTSPGVPEAAEVLTWARERGLEIWSELELGARLCTVPYVAVTGTNGKTTTTEMVAASMRASGLDAVACGNVGHPFTAAARESHDALAVEASSFQLRFHRSFHPRVSVLLNVAEDHLDWHGDVDRYSASKARIFAMQGEGDTHVGNADDERAALISRAAPCRTLWFRLGEPGPDETGYEAATLVSRIDGTHDLGSPGPDSRGFRSDAAAAAAAGLAFGLDASAVAEGVCGFAPLAHRGEVVAEIAGVRFVNDSKATNPHAALAALEGVEHAVLIAGGDSKGVDLSPLGAAAPRLDGVVAIGLAAPEIERVFAGATPVRRAETLREAVAEAFSMTSSGGTVLLAPACASQDMFRDYRERGERFAAAVAELADRTEAADGRT